MLLFACTLLLLVSHGLAQEEADDRGYTISYNGSLHGSYVSGNSNMSSCGNRGTYYFSGLSDTIFKIGPPAYRERNPFFFSLNHAGRDYRNTPTANTATQKQSHVNRKDPLVRRFGYECFNIGGCTEDALYNLQIISSWYYYNTEPPYDFINMNKSVLSVVDSGAGLGEKSELPYYSLIGGIDSWQTYDKEESYFNDWEGFNFQIPHNYSEYEGQEDSICDILLEHLVDWTYLKNLTYALKFTNNSAEATILVTTNTSTVITFNFSGARTDALNGTQWDFEENSPIPIVLSSPKSHVTPQFTFANGSSIPKEHQDINPAMNDTKEDIANGHAGLFSSLTFILVTCLVMAMY